MDQSMCQGADRIFAGVGTAAVRKCFSKFMASGAELVVIDTIRSTLLNENTMDAARAAGFVVRILELNAPVLPYCVAGAAGIGCEWW